MPNLEDIAFKVIITKNPDYDIVFRTILLGASASQMAYNNSSSGLEATTVQGAIDELKTDIDDLLPQILPKGEASGSIASFETDYEYPLLKCECEFSASQASGTPTPSTPIPIVGVDKVNVALSGKNIMDMNYLTATGITVTNGEAVGTSSSFNSAFGQGAKGLKGKMIFKPNTQYTISVQAYNEGNTSTTGNGLWFIIYYTDETYTRVQFGNADTSYSLKTATSSVSKTIDYIAISYGSTGSNIWHVKEFQVEQNTEATTYEPYNGTTALINLGGTYYRGSVDAVTGLITLTHKKYVIDENSDITWRTSSNTAVFDVDAYTKYRYGGDLLLCDTLQAVNVAGFDALSDNQIGMLNNSGDTTYSRIPFKVENITSKADMQTWLASHNITIVVNLATPIVVYASNTAEIPTIVGDNQVFADTGDVEVVYIESVHNAIDQKLAELTASMIAYNNTASGLTATNVQNAIDEIASSGNRSTLASLLRGSEDMREDNSLPLSEEAEREEMREPESTEER